MIQLRVQVSPARRATLPSGLTRMAVDIGQRRPVVAACGSRFDDRWSQSSSVSYDVQNDTLAPPAGTVIVLVSRLYDTSLICEYM